MWKITNCTETASKIIFLFFMLVNNNFSYGSETVNISPAINTVSSGPIKWIKDRGVRFRVITLLSEVYLSIYIQKISYGSENCCVKTEDSYEIDLEKLSGRPYFYSVDDFVWLGFDKVQFKGDSKIYTIDILDRKNH